MGDHHSFYATEQAARAAGDELWDTEIDGIPFVTEYTVQSDDDLATTLNLLTGALRHATYAKTTTA
jgi:hypothetical protein